MNHFVPEIVYEDNHFIAINKPAGLLVQGDATGDIPLTELMKTYIRKRDSKPGNVFMGLIHRLDRPVTGLVLLAKTSKGLERMNKLFQTRTVSKTYLALTHGRPKMEKATLKHFLLKNEKENFVKAFETPKSGCKEAVLEYELLAVYNGNSLLSVQPHTGRSHQIRVQLSSMNCPIIGDTKYGSAIANKDLSICLHAYQLRFVHPIQQVEIEIKTPIPAWALFAF